MSKPDPIPDAALERLRCLGHTDLVQAGSCPTTMPLAVGGESMGCSVADLARELLLARRALYDAPAVARNAAYGVAHRAALALSGLPGLCAALDVREGVRVGVPRAVVELVAPHLDQEMRDALLQSVGLDVARARV